LRNVTFDRDSNEDRDADDVWDRDGTRDRGIGRGWNHSCGAETARREDGVRREMVLTRDYRKDRENNRDEAYKSSETRRGDFAGRRKTPDDRTGSGERGNGFSRFRDSVGDYGRDRTGSSAKVSMDQFVQTGLSDTGDRVEETRRGERRLKQSVCAVTVTGMLRHVTDVLLTTQTTTRTRTINVNVWGNGVA